MQYGDELATEGKTILATNQIRLITNSFSTLSMIITRILKLNKTEVGGFSSQVEHNLYIFDYNLYDIRQMAVGPRPKGVFVSNQVYWRG